jgi:hypothetical protein
VRVMLDGSRRCSAAQRMTLLCERVSKLAGSRYGRS